MNKTITALFVFSFLYSMHSNAQNFIGIHFNFMQPISDYQEVMSTQPKGIGLNYMFKPRIFKRIYFGAQIGVSMYATDEYEHSVQIDEEEWMDIEIQEEDCFFAYGVTGRYYLVEEKLINPYFEVRLGGMSFFSTKMTDEEYDDYYENSTTFHGTALQTGIGGGVSYHAVDNLWIDFNVIYNGGSQTDYRHIGSSDIDYRIEPGQSKFESYTNNLNFSLGVQFGF